MLFPKFMVCCNKKNDKITFTSTTACGNVRVTTGKGLLILLVTNISSSFFQAKLKGWAYIPTGEFVQANICEGKEMPSRLRKRK